MPGNLDISLRKMAIPTHSQIRISRFIARAIQFGFSILYHQAAWIYDQVAWLVSGGRWFEWGLNAGNLISGQNILEIGFGTGHLMQALSGIDRLVIGLDESRQMCRISRQRLSSSMEFKETTMIIRGQVQHLPLGSMSIDSIISNFPSEYIFDSRSITEIHRVLKPGGKLIILLSAWVNGTSLHDRFGSFVFRIFGQPNPEKIDLFPYIKLLTQHQLEPHPKWVSHHDSLCLLILATRKDP